MPDPSTWADDVASAQRDGFTYYDLLTAHDDIGRTGTIVVTLRLRNPGSGEVTTLVTAVPRDEARLPDIAALFPGAAWGQRYVHDFYGVRFDGADLRPLLNHDGGAPLRKDFVLAARAVVPYPADDDRRGQPPGVPAPEVWGDRDPTLAPATPDEIVSSATTRTRRRR